MIKTYYEIEYSGHVIINGIESNEGNKDIFTIVDHIIPSDDSLLTKQYFILSLIGNTIMAGPFNSKEDAVNFIYELLTYNRFKSVIVKETDSRDLIHF